MECKYLGFIDNGTGKHQSNMVFDSEGLAPTITTVKDGGTQQIKVIEVGELKRTICASRGRNPDNPSDRSSGINLEQRLEPNEQGICNTLTSVQKDNLVLEQKSIKIHQATKDGFIELGSPEFYHFLYAIDGDIYLIRIRKLVPRECWRLMSFSDEDFDKAEKVNSNTQLYKQAGNSIVVKVLEAIFRQMIESED